MNTYILTNGKENVDQPNANRSQITDDLGRKHLSRLQRNNVLWSQAKTIIYTY